MSARPATHTFERLTWADINPLLSMSARTDPCRGTGDVVARGRGWSKKSPTENAPFVRDVDKSRQKLKMVGS